MTKASGRTREVLFVRHLWNMIELARPITIGALNRNESRGAHYKPEFPERNDNEFLKTTMAHWSSDGPRFTWENIDTSRFRCGARRYDVDTSHSKAKAA